MLKQWNCIFKKKKLYKKNYIYYKIYIYCLLIFVTSLFPTPVLFKFSLFFKFFTEGNLLRQPLPISVKLPQFVTSSLTSTYVYSPLAHCTCLLSGTLPSSSINSICAVSIHSRIKVGDQFTVFSLPHPLPHGQLKNLLKLSSLYL